MKQKLLLKEMLEEQCYRLKLSRSVIGGGREELKFEVP
jgi:hypothetical protein